MPSERRVMTGLKLHRSAGVPVTFRVHRLLKQANRARDTARWYSAADLYARALKLAPELTHIYVQHGHVLKELKDLDGAEAAYLQARARAPKDSDPSLHLGHVRKLRGDMTGASRYYVESFRNDPTNIDAGIELHRMIASNSAGMTREQMLSAVALALPGSPASTTKAEDPVGDAQHALRAVLKRLTAAEAEPGSTLAAAIQALASIDLKAGTGSDAPLSSSEHMLVFDLSDLIGYYSHARLPTGIQRVQIETVSSALNGPDASRVRLCCFIEGRDDWLEIPTDLFMNVVKKSVEDDTRNDPEWVGLINHLRLTLALSEPMRFPQGAYLINLGTSWWIQNYFLFVRHAKTEYGIRYIPLVHDLIPVLTPEHCVTGLTQDFISWLLGVFDHADFYLTVSSATKRDLLAVAEQLGHSVDPSAVRVIGLNADFRKPLKKPVRRDALTQRGLEPGGYVLFVSTIESRKNHMLAFDAWLRLAAVHGPKAVPRLVCIGRRGWLNESTYARLDQNKLLRDKVMMLTGIPDEELALFYSECLFTIYPSVYEGWGLPVTESLCYGKVPLISDASSLPEAGGEFADYFESASLNGFVAGLERLIFDPAYRKKREAFIAENFRPETWVDVGKRIFGEVQNWMAADNVKDHGFVPPLLKLNSFYPLIRNVETRVWKGLGLTEIYRGGLGWWWPEEDGCWTRQTGGEMCLHLPASAEPLRIYLRLRGLPTKASPYSVTSADGVIDLKGFIAAGADSWLAIDVMGSDEPQLVRLKVCGQATEEISGKGVGWGTGNVYVGVSGFFICRVEDLHVRMDFLEAAMLGNFDQLNAYRDQSDATANSRAELAPTEGGPRPWAARRVVEIERMAGIVQ
jgi:glycosyltransferase involved in cell wall biosynthesis